MIQQPDFVYFSQVGAGVIFFSDDQINDAIDRQPAELAFGTLKPGDMTTMVNRFNRPIKYLGLLKEKSDVLKCMAFEFHRSTDLFETKIYVDCYHIVSGTRLFKKYNDVSGRDYNFINGKWN
jgi:hypothetical protein